MLSAIPPEVQNPAYGNLSGLALIMNTGLSRRILDPRWGQPCFCVPYIDIPVAQERENATPTA